MKSKAAVDGIRWGFLRVLEIPNLYNPEETYLRRFRLIETPLFGVKVHHIFMDDPAVRGTHSHPWNFLSIRLKGRYTEELEDPITGEIRYEKNRFWSLRKTHEYHRVLASKPVWTLVINGRRQNDWGFIDPQTHEFKYWHQFDGPQVRSFSVWQYLKKRIKR